MAEYIEREAAFNAILKLVPKVDGDGYCWVIRGDAATAIDAIPAADVRPVVLCRDCKHNMANIPDIQDGININENWNACQLTELYDSIKPDDFCSRGKKREES